MVAPESPKYLARLIVWSEGSGLHDGLIRGLVGRTMVAQFLGLHYGLIRGLLIARSSDKRAKSGKWSDQNGLGSRTKTWVRHRLILSLAIFTFVTSARHLVTLITWFRRPQERMRWIPTHLSLIRDNFVYRWLWSEIPGRGFSRKITEKECKECKNKKKYPPFLRLNSNYRST